MSLQINCSKRSKTRYNGYTGRRNNRSLFAFVKAEEPSCNTSFTQVRRRNTKRSQFRPKKTFMTKVTPSNHTYNLNRFTALDNQDDTPVLKVNIPKVVKPKAPIGVWGGNKPKKVSFAQDNANTLMKPTATQVKEFNKDDAPNTINAKVDKYPEEDEYLKLKRSNNAWKPKKRETTSTEVEVAKNALKKLIDEQKKTPMINWADCCSSDEESDEEEEDEEIVLDQFGRPLKDNSSW